MLFDEHVSVKVARALHALGLNVNHIGGEGQPPRGSADAEILQHARATNQVIVTTNHDMVVLCAESNESVIWLSPRDRDLSLAAITVLCFTQVRDWEELLVSANDPVAVVARKTTCEPLSLAKAARIAKERGKRRRRAEARGKQAPPLGELFPVEGDAAGTDGTPSP